MRRASRWLIAALVIAAGATILARRPAPSPPTERPNAALSHARSLAAPAGRDTLSLALAAPVRIVTDRFGVPHIQARNLSDLYFAWGFVTARDRLWQMLENRQTGDGERWRWYGNSALRGDGGAQLFELRAHAESTWSALRVDPDAGEALTRFADGVNAWINECRSGRRPWPAEVLAFRVEPRDWIPSDSILLLIGQGVLLDLDLPELDEAKDIETHGTAWMKERRRFEDRLIYDTIPDSAARRIAGARGTVSAGARDNASVSAPLASSATWALEGFGATRDPDQRASNVFAVGPGRSTSGAALFANDPHLPLSVPGPLHAIHVTCADTVDAIGFCAPGMPAIVSGRNARCAWGITSLGADVVDVYADTLSRDGRHVLVHGRPIAIRERPYDLRYLWLGMPLPALGQTRRYTPHGPMVAFDRGKRIALSVRWAGLEGLATGPRVFGIERSASAGEVCERFLALRTPALNLVAADREGHVRYQACGAVPDRASDPGPGALVSNGPDEWLGLITPARLPGWDVPRDGFVVNSNNRPAGLAWPEPQPRYDWAQDRALRIAGRLASMPRVSIDDLARIQNDVHSRGGERLVPALLACADSLRGSLDARERAALDTLRAWDFEARRARVAPTIYRGWLGALQRRSRLGGLAGLTLAALEGRAPEALLVPRGTVRERPAVAAIEALHLAMDSLSVLLGRDLAGWTWERSHRAVFRDALAGRSGAGPGPTSEDGDNSTPCVGASHLPWNTRVTHGPAFRHLVDLAVPESPLAVLTPGNSGDRSSPHLTDQLARWANHEYVPLYLSWKRIEQARESEMLLTPATSRPRR